MLLSLIHSYRGDIIRRTYLTIDGSMEHEPCYIVDGIGSDVTFATLDDARAAVDGMHDQAAADALRYGELFPA